MKTQYPIRTLCRTLEVSASAYYAWLERRATPGPRARQNQRLTAMIQAEFKASRHTYGSPRIQQALRQQGHAHGRNRIARLMRQQQLCGRQRKRFKVRTTDSRHDQPIAPNRLAQQPEPQQPNRIWVTDITYIGTGQKWLYLSAVMDLYSRRIIGWAMSKTIDTELVLASWRMALGRRPAPDQLILHSDRGCQYASAEFRNALQQQGALASMSRKANCYDNAAMESFWSTLKLELVYRREFATHAEARAEIFSFIELFYNPKRLHSSLNYLSPVDFENKNN
jgi:transposase InsO family protein